MKCLVLIDVPIISAGYGGTLISAWCIMWSGYIILPNLLLYKPLEPIELSCYFSWSSHITNNDSSKCIDVICSHFPRHHNRKMSFIMHMILCKIRVRPRYFIKWVRPSRPRQNVTQLTQMIRMTRPGCNAGAYTFHHHPMDTTID